MKKVLLLSNYVFHYRINNYNYFHRKFKEHNIDFNVLTYGAQSVDFPIDFPLVIKKQGIVSYCRYIAHHKPAAVILFLHLSDFVLFPLLIYCRLFRFPVIYWNFGIDLKDPNNRLKNWLYRRVHMLANKILLYSPKEIIFIKPGLRNKVFVANNTVNLTALDKHKLEGNYIKEHYNIKEEFIVLFFGRIIPAKKVDVLLKCFRGDKDIALVIAGKGMSVEMQETINEVSNFYYLGEIEYNNLISAKIIHGADIICNPGNVGLIIVEAFYWGKPVITLENSERLNSPEIWYLKNNKNGFIVKNEQEMEEKARYLLNHREIYNEFSICAKQTANNEAHINNMFEGFYQVVNKSWVND